MVTEKDTVHDVDGDSDSISITSTAPSEPRDEYPVERILGERKSEEDGTVWYLVEWEGYPIQRATWEPEGNFADDYPIHKWKETKMKISRGHAEPFDVDAWEREQEEIAEGKKRRRARRKAKRIRLGLPVPDSDDDDGEDAGEAAGPEEQESSDDDVPLVRRRRTWDAGNLQGFVVEDDEDQPVRRRKRRSLPANSSEDDVTDDSTMEALGQKAAKKRSGTAGIQRNEQRDGTIPVGNTVPKKSASISIDSLHQAVKASAQPAVRPAVGVSRVSKVASTPIASSVAAAAKMARRSAAKSKKSGVALMSNWQKPAKQRKREKLNPQKTNEIGAKKFKTVSEVRRFELAARNEPAPNLEDLLKLRRGSAPQVSGLDENAESPLFVSQDPDTLAGAEVSKEIDLGRFNPDKPRTAGTSAGEASTEPVPPAITSHAPVPAEPLAITQKTMSKTVDSSSKPAPLAPSRVVGPQENFKIPLTCYYWNRDKKCPFTAQECKFSHRQLPEVAPLALHAQLGDVHRLPKFFEPPLTCYYWYYTRYCSKTTVECKFAHWNTGLVAKMDVRIPPTPVPIDSPRHQAEHPGAPSTMPLSAKNMTCFFWKRGKCNKSESTCTYAHRKCAVDAPPPPSYRWSSDEPVRPEQENQSNSNLTSVAARSDFAQVQPAPPPPPLPESCSDDHVPPPPPSPPIPNSNKQSLAQAFPFTFSMGSAVSNEPAHNSRPGNAVQAFMNIPTDVQGETSEFEVQLLGFDDAAKERFLAGIGSGSCLDVQYTCLASDFETYFDQQVASAGVAGDVIPSPGAASAFDAYAERLKLQMSGGIVCHVSFTMVIFPVHQEYWSFLNPKTPPAPHAALRFRVLPPSVDLQLEPATLPLTLKNSAASSIEAAFSQILGIDSERLFAWNEGQKVEKQVFLMFHPRYEDEIELLTRFLQGVGAKVYTSAVPGSWEYFRSKNRSGLVLFHPEMYFYHQIPYLSSLTQGRFNFFQLGPAPLPNADSSEQVYSCVRMFPHGSIVFVTDDVFVYRPEDALAISNHIIEKNQRAPFTLRHWKLAGRPGLKMWLLELCNDHEKEILRAGKTTRLKLYYNMDVLAPQDLQEPWNPPNPSEDAALVSVPPEDLPGYYDLWKQDEAAASDFMVNWFAGWACTQVFKWRRFIVVHSVERPDWKESYKHIDVITPEKYMTKYGK